MNLPPRVSKLTGASESPYRIFFPIGLTLAGLGAALWSGFSLGWLPGYPVVQHALLMTQGFLCAVVFGFVFTMLPRRTETARPKGWEVMVTGAGLVGLGAFSVVGAWVPGQITWLVSLLIVGRFIAIRLLRPQRAPPKAFVWLWWAVGIGLIGAGFAGAGGVLGDSAWWLHELGEEWVKHGMLTAFVFAVAPLVVAVMCRGTGTIDGDDSPRSKRERLGHHLGAALLVIAITTEVLWSETAGLLLRAVLTLTVLLVSIGPWSAPAKPGLLRWAILVSLWFLPVGPLISALVPAYRAAAMHLTYITGFGLLSLAAGSQVAFGHEGMETAKLRTPLPAVLALGFVLLAAFARQLVQLDPARYYVWLTAASLLLVGAALASVLPFVFRTRVS